MDLKGRIPEEIADLEKADKASRESAKEHAIAARIETLERGHLCKGGTASPLLRALLQEAGMQLPDHGDCRRPGGPAGGAAEGIGNAASSG